MTDKGNLQALMEALGELGQVMQRLNTQLAPVTDRERQLKDGIAATHGGPGKFNPAGAPARAPKFNELTDIAAKHGPSKAERKRIVSAVKSMQREIDTLESQLNVGSKKKV